MKHVFTILTTLFVSASALLAQGTANLILFTENGEKFTLILNGQRMNDAPASNVKVTDLTAPNYKGRIVFDDEKLGQINKDILVNPGSEVTYNVKKNNKGEFVIRYISEVPLAQAPPTPTNQTAVNINQVPPNDGMVIRTSTGTTGTTVTTTTSTTTVGNTTGVNVNVNDMGGIGINMNVNINDPLLNGTTTTTSYTTTTTTTTTDGGFVETTNTNPAPTNTNGGCSSAMSTSDFSSVKSSIQSKTFEDSKLTMAKSIVKSKCFSSAQVKEVMMLFEFEESRLEFAKIAYARVTDKDNYYIVNDAFTFETSIEDLQRAIGQ